MAVMDAQKAAQALRQAMHLGRAGQLDAADRLLGRILARQPDNADALQLSGMVARMRGLNECAIDRFRQSIALGGGAHVRNNLGNALLAVGQREEAVEAYRSATEMAPDYLDAWINLGLALIESGKDAPAEAALERAVTISPGSAKAWAALGRARRARNKLPLAVAAFENALRLRPDHLPTMHNLAVALRLAGNPARALALLERCAACDPGSLPVRYNMGHCLQDLGRFEGAAASYRAVIAADPAHRDAHRSLSRLLWQTGNRRDHLKSYADALARAPHADGLLADFAYRLTLEGRPAEAAALLADAIARGIDGAEPRHRLGQALWSLGRPEEALVQFAAASQADPADAAIARELVRSLIVLGRYDEALARIDAVLSVNQDDQQAIAYRHLCLRLTGDARAPDPGEAERLVTAIPLSPPPGQGSVREFNARLAAALDPLHNMTTHPLEQTLRGGTQTVGDLFDQPIPEIAVLRSMIEEAVGRHIAALADDPHHPFLRRKAAGFAFSGSWSVRLLSGGHHMNHVHPEGWISSCYYVDLPLSVEQGTGPEGWLKIGESALGLGVRERIDRLIRPRIGTLVLFPSYFYHGTVPFTDPRPRTTIAFDIVPADE